MLPHRKRRGKGVIINTSSNSAFFDKGMLAYITSKTAVIAMTEQTALDYGPDDIRVNALCPRLGRHAVQQSLYLPDGGRGVIDAHVKDQIQDGPPSQRRPDRGVDPVSRLRPLQAHAGHALVIDGGESIA